MKNCSCHVVVCPGCRALLAALLAWGVAAGAASFPPADSTSVAAVRDGRLSEARAVWWGFDPTNATAALQAAIGSGVRRLIVENVGAPWIIDPVQLVGDQEIVFEPGVVITARRGGFAGRGDSLFSANQLTNLTLTGTGAVLRMWREDYATTNYAKAEWRHCLMLRACVNVRVSGLTLTESGGDGIYVGAGPKGEPCRDVVIRDVICAGNYRQGISVISAENLLLERVTLRDTGGTAPMAGIDFEPNHPFERVVNCVLRDCTATGNAGGGFLFALHQLSGTSQPVSVRLERCLAKDNQRAALLWHVAPGRPEGSLRGGAEFRGCVFAGDSGPVVQIGDNAAGAAKLRFSGCRIEAGTNSSAAISFRTRRGGTSDVGGVVFDGGSIAVPAGRVPIEWQDDGGFRGLRDIRGEFLLRIGDREEACRLDRRRLTEWIPALAAFAIPRHDFDVSRMRPVKGGSVNSGEPRTWRLRHEADLVAWAKEGEAFDLAVRVETVGPGPHAIPIQVTGPSGAEILRTTVEAGAERLLRVAAREEGVHRITCGTNGAVFRIRSPQLPLAAASDRRAVHFFGIVGDYAFRVPAGVRELGLRITGSGPHEGVAAALVNPRGERVDYRDDITTPHLLRATRPADAPGETWRLRLEKPAHVALEDYSLILLGIPPLIAPDPAALLDEADAMGGPAASPAGKNE